MLVVMLLLLPFSTREEGEGIEEKGSVEIAPGIYMPYVSNGFINDAPVNGNLTASRILPSLHRYLEDDALIALITAAARKRGG